MRKSSMPTSITCSARSPATASKWIETPDAKRAAMRPVFSCSDVEEEVQHVAVLHHVILAFLAQTARGGGASLTLVLDEVVVAHGFGADEATLEIGVDHACSLRGGEAALDGPRAHFLHACGEVG